MQFELDDVEVETIRWALDNELDDFHEEVDTKVSSIPSSNGSNVARLVS